MQTRHIARNRWLVLGLGLVALIASTAPAQFSFDAIQQNQPAGDASGPAVKVSAFLTPPEGDRPAELAITADISPGWHIYSTTQKSGGPIPTKIALAKSDSFELAGPIVADPPPDVKVEPLFGPNFLAESHEGRVTWRAPLKLAAGVNLAELAVTGTALIQACNATSCLPPEKFPFEARLAAGDATAGEYESPDAHVRISGFLRPAAAAPGSEAELVLTATPTDGWHVYAQDDRDTDAVGVGKPTLIALTQASGLKTGSITANARPIERESKIMPGTVERYYEEPVSWTIPIEIPANAKLGNYPVDGLIGYQTCLDGKGCDLPQALKFEGTITVGSGAEQQPKQQPLRFTKAESYRDVGRRMAATPAASAGAGLDFNQIESSTESSSRSLMLVLGAALIGGFILNFMPCVLPVIGLKILSFVEQSGDSRGRILSLNLWFTAGLLSVFLLLATLAVAFETSWGDQFTKPWFNVGMAGLVFAMALSFLGVWEIPIPGFVGTSSASRMADKEGAIGAFSKGIVTTLLATPCSGPFLGTVFGFTLRQPPAVVYAIFGCVGLGMASPYLLIGAFPQLVRFLPRPGAWMETFKQIMGFVLLGTVVFVFSFIQDKFQVATFAFLIGIWAACWWIGRTPLTAEFSQKATAWIGGTLLAAAVGFAAFGFVLREGPELPWQPFSRDRLVALTAERKTVMVDFTADWCANCKTNERFALNTRDVQSLVSEYDIVPLVADYTDGSEEISEMLRLLGSRSIPVLAIFPADDPNKPIVLRDLVTQGQVLDALREAGPSQSSLAERTDGAVTTTSVR